MIEKKMSFVMLERYDLIKGIKTRDKRLSCTCSFYLLELYDLIKVIKTMIQGLRLPCLFRR